MLKVRFKKACILDGLTYLVGSEIEVEAEKAHSLVEAEIVEILNLKPKKKVETKESKVKLETREE